ncbi:hypothetical protein [Luteolibacter marinus]|uniref:hypothetical protein n=1 Tax=Luteolibacter marinus TaxID=2776705 RepID=UPI0018684A51|nr:hypothetical protein [Luteolibacter marinus]
MDLLLEILLTKTFLFDAFGVIGLGLLGLAAVRLSQRYQSWGGSLLSSGALLLLLGRLMALLRPQIFTPGLQDALGRSMSDVLLLAPTALMTMGLAGIVWGLWGHEQWLREER